MTAITTQLLDQSIDLNAYLAGSKDPACGASLVFTGVVRDHNHGKTVVSVSYDAFAPLCQKVLQEICEEALSAFEPRARISLIHRLGELKVGEISVLIIVNTPHRDESYKISRYVIENLKTRAPIWKKEAYDRGESEWLEGHALCSHPEPQSKTQSGNRL